MKTRLFLILFAILTLVFGSGILADGPAEGRAGRAEVRFMESMIDHHQMAVDMANDCQTKASAESVTTLCQNIIDAQTAEIETLQAWLLEWYNVEYKPTSLMPSDESAMEGMDHGSMNAGDGVFTDPPMTMGMMAGLNRLEGSDYEIAWLEAMIDHHDDALHVSERLLERVPADAGHGELRDLAEQIIADQTAEIEEIERLLAEYAA